MFSFLSPSPKKGMPCCSFSFNFVAGVSEQDFILQDPCWTSGVRLWPLRVGVRRPLHSARQRTCWICLMFFAHWFSKVGSCGLDMIGDCARHLAVESSSPSVLVTSSLDPVNSNFSCSCSIWAKTAAALSNCIRQYLAGLPAFPSTANGWWCMVNDDGWCRFMWIINKLYVWLSMMFCPWPLEVSESNSDSALHETLFPYFWDHCHYNSPASPPKVTTNLTIGSRKKHITCILFLHRHLKATRSPHLLIIFSHYFHHNFWMHLLPPPLAATSVATSTAGEPPSPQRRRAINGVMVWPNWLFQQLLSRVSWSVKDAFQESVWNMSEIIMVFLQRANNLERCTRGSIVTSSCSKT